MDDAHASASAIPCAGVSGRDVPWSRDRAGCDVRNVRPEPRPWHATGPDQPRDAPRHHGQLPARGRGGGLGGGGASAGSGRTAGRSAGRAWAAPGPSALRRDRPQGRPGLVDPAGPPRRLAKPGRRHRGDGRIAAPVAAAARPAHGPRPGRDPPQPRPARRRRSAPVGLSRRNRPRRPCPACRLRPVPVRTVPAPKHAGKDAWRSDAMGMDRPAHPDRGRGAAQLDRAPHAQGAAPSRPRADRHRDPCGIVQAADHRLRHRAGLVGHGQHLRLFRPHRRLCHAGHRDRRGHGAAAVPSSAPSRPC